MSPPAAPAHNGSFPRPVLVLLGTAAALSLVGWLLFFLAVRQTHRISAGGLFPEGAAYDDLTVYIRRFDVFRTRAFFEQAVPALHRSRFAYPPAAVFPYEFLYRSHHMKFTYNLLSAGLWLTLLGLLGTALWRTAGKINAILPLLVCFALLGYPALFLFERANIEIFVWALLVGAALLYLRGSLEAAAACLGIAIAMKLYPVFLLGIFVGRRRGLGPLSIGLATATLVTVLSIAVSAPGFFWLGARGYLEGITGFQAKYAGSLDAGPVAFDHSLFSLIKLTALHAGRRPLEFTKPYYMICGLLAALAFFVWVRHRPFLNQFTFLTGAMILLPPVSFEYTLVHLYLPSGLLLLALAKGGRKTRSGSRVALVAFASLLAILLPVNLLGPAADYAGQVLIVPLLILMVSAAWRPWEPNASEPGSMTGAVAAEGCHAAPA